MVVVQVETATDSAPLLSLLAPLDSGSQHSYWKAPPTSTCAEFVVVLSTLSDVTGVVLVISPCGYSEADAPTVCILSLSFFKSLLLMDVNGLGD